MKQLGILDAAFINLEQGNTPQHVGGLGIYDPSTAPGGFVRFKQVIANFEQRLQRLPLFRTRLVEVPGGIDRPYWVKDAHFDVEFHLRHIALPQPGDWRQLCIQVARLHARPLDMSRPLWEAYIIEGLDNMPDLPEGSFAVYTKMHHALVDGAGGASFMSALHDLVPEPGPNAQTLADAPLLVDREPTTSELVLRAGINSVTNSVAMVRGALGLTRELGKFAFKVARKDIPLPDLQAPASRFNRPVGPHRVFDSMAFPIADFKRIKAVTNVKMNDMALAIVGGALARYLDSKGETPDGSLAASLPVNMRTRRGETDDNNQVGAIFARLHTDIADPKERLMAIHHTTQEAKQFGENSPLVDALKVAGIFNPMLSKPLAEMWAKRQLSRFVPANTSTVVTNVRGPDFDLYCAGARLVQYDGLGVLTPAMGLFHTVFSQADRVHLSVLADRDIMPDPAFYVECLQAAHKELLEAFGLQATAPAKKRPARRKAAAGKNATGKGTGKAAADRAAGKGTGKAAAGKGAGKAATGKGAGKAAAKGKTPERKAQQTGAEDNAATQRVAESTPAATQPTDTGAAAPAEPPNLRVV